MAVSTWDIVSGLVVLTLMLTTNPRSVGIALLVESLTAFGDMSNVLGSRGSKQAAFSIHGVTFAVMVIVGLFLIHVFRTNASDRRRRTSFAHSQ